MAANSAIVGEHFQNSLEHTIFNFTARKAQ
jgi:hypothetical protein